MIQNNRLNRINRRKKKKKEKSKHKNINMEDKIKNITNIIIMG